MIGYSEKDKGYRCLDNKTGKINLSRHVVFDELKFPFNKENTSSSSDKSSKITVFSKWDRTRIKGSKILDLYNPKPMIEKGNDKSKITIEGNRKPLIGQRLNQETQILVDQEVQTSTTDQETQNLSDQSINENLVRNTPANNNDPIQTKTMMTRSMAGIKKPNPKYFCLTQVKQSEPKNVSEALQSIEWKML